MKKRSTSKTVREEIVVNCSLSLSCHFERGPKGGYTANFPKFPALSAHGPSLKAARAAAQAAVEAWVEAKEIALLQEVGWEPPGNQ